MRFMIMTILFFVALVCCGYLYYDGLQKNKVIAKTAHALRKFDTYLQENIKHGYSINLSYPLSCNKQVQAILGTSSPKEAQKKLEKVLGDDLFFCFHYNVFSKQLLIEERPGKDDRAMRVFSDLERGAVLYSKEIGKSGKDKYFAGVYLLDGGLALSLFTNSVQSSQNKDFAEFHAEKENIFVLPFVAIDEETLYWDSPEYDESKIKKLLAKTGWSLKIGDGEIVHQDGYSFQWY